MPPTSGNATVYDQIIWNIFRRYHGPNITEFLFLRSELEEAARDIGVSQPLNLGDIPYTYRYRRDLPEGIRATAPAGKEWHIFSVGKGRYQFKLQQEILISPRVGLASIKILDATPGVIKRYAQGDEQALLAILRYNRLVDIFTGLTCYSLQNHLRTTVTGIGQVETDEMYIGIDKRGAQYILPIQAKGGTDRLGPVQIKQDIAMCEEKFAALECRPIAAQFVGGNETRQQDSYLIALFEFQDTEEGLRIVSEKHYRLVDSSDLSDLELDSYRTRPFD